MTAAPRPAAPKVVPLRPTRPPSLDELESGNLGRSPSFPPGWWIVPMLVLEAALFGAVLWWWL